ncbi:hypothetical protein R1sor_011289 [Riccia sorocarpa]|uniref:Cationic amino acid transporter C-terminal domain-containing protein n=1 Tax=Riccia sorocarpa TaxID=122646 RepID=A0ABD3I0G8_9MARC
MAETRSLSSFSSFGAYANALRRTPQRFWERAGVVSSVEAELTDVSSCSGATFKRRLEWYEVVGMGVGGMVGAGIFVTTGSVARTSAGPAVILSYLVAGFTALLSALCYTDFAVELPVAGGAFSYLKITFGEFAAYFTGANLILEYVLSNAAVARTFLSYLVSVFTTRGADSWRVKTSVMSDGFNHLDFAALALVVVITIILCYSTKHGAIFNLVVTLVHLVFIFFIIIAGFALGDRKNLTQPGFKSSPGGFTPYGLPGIFNGAAVVYFSYIGYDAVSTMAEEVKNPGKAMPIGVAGSVIIVTVVYCLMATSICLLQPYDQIDTQAPFAMAFKSIKGWEWAASFVGVGASLGILTSLLVSMLGQARYLCVIGRSRVVPFWFATIHRLTGTPLNATVFLGFWTALFSLFTDLEVLLDMVSIGTLFVFYMVANALIFHRHVGQGHKNTLVTLCFLGVLSVSAVGFVLVWSLNPDCWWGLLLFGCLSLVISILYYWSVPPASSEPRIWQLPMIPLVASMSIFLNVFLLGSVNAAAYKRFALWSAVAVVYYLLYGVHATYDAAKETGTNGAFLMLQPLEPDTEMDANLEMEDGSFELTKVRSQQEHFLTD